MLDNAHNNLGNALGDIGQMDASALIKCFEKALAIKPEEEYAEGHNNLG